MSRWRRRRELPDRRGLGRGLCGLAVAAALALAPVAGAAECEGDDCQVPPAPPAEVLPATAFVEGPANPPVRFEGQKPAAPKPGGHHHHHHGKRR
jgi:hypothetical protein